MAKRHGNLERPYPFFYPTERVGAIIISREKSYCKEKKVRHFI